MRYRPPNLRERRNPAGLKARGTLSPPGFGAGTALGSSAKFAVRLISKSAGFAGREIAARIDIDKQDRSRPGGPRWPILAWETSRFSALSGRLAAGGDVHGRSRAAVMRHLSQYCENRLPGGGLFLMFSESPVDGSTAKQVGVHDATEASRCGVNGGKTPALGRRAGWIAAAAPVGAPNDRPTSRLLAGTRLGRVRRNHPRIHSVSSPTASRFRSRCGGMRVGKTAERTLSKFRPLCGGRNERASVMQGLRRRGSAAERQWFCPLQEWKGDGRYEQFH